MGAPATRSQVRAYAMSKPYATKVRIQRNGLVQVHGLRRKGGLGWYFLGSVYDLAAMLPLYAADGDLAAIAALSKRKNAGPGI